MAFELQILGWGLILWIVQLAAMGRFAHVQLGSEYLIGPRDEPRPRTGLAGRLQRAYQNHVEWTLFHAIATILVVLSDSASGFTAICAGVWLAARIIYVPLYALGSVPWRTVVFTAGLCASLLMLLAALF